MSLTIEQIATNRYAPAGADAISLYGTELADGLTLGQLVIAVSMRSAAEYEAQGVVKMNRMAGGSEKLEKMAAFMEDIAAGFGPHRFIHPVFIHLAVELQALGQFKHVAGIILQDDRDLV